MKVSNILLWVFLVIIWLQITLYMVFTSKSIYRDVYKIQIGNGYWYIEEHSTIGIESIKVKFVDDYVFVKVKWHNGEQEELKYLREYVGYVDYL